jgi:hypothetical protein
MTITMSKEQFTAALEQLGMIDNLGITAKQFGVNYTTLWRWMKGVKPVPVAIDALLTTKLELQELRDQQQETGKPVPPAKLRSFDQLITKETTPGLRAMIFELEDATPEEITAVRAVIKAMRATKRQKKVKP